jgi:hypothetical protein
MNVATMVNWRTRLLESSRGSDINQVSHVLDAGHRPGPAIDKRFAIYSLTPDRTALKQAVE